MLQALERAEEAQKWQMFDFSKHQLLKLVGLMGVWWLGPDGANSKVTAGFKEEAAAVANKSWNCSKRGRKYGYYQRMGHLKSLLNPQFWLSHKEPVAGPGNKRG